MGMTTSKKIMRSGVTHGASKMMRKTMSSTGILKRAASGARIGSKRARLMAPGRGVKAYGVNNNNKQTKAGVPSDADCLGMVGSAQETDCAHAERHKLAHLDRWAKVCDRCCYLKWTSRTAKRIPVWLSRKPSFMQGAWGVGCTFCAAGRHSGQVHQMRSKHMQDNIEAGRCKQAISRAGVWSGYEYRGFQSAHYLALAIDKHESGDYHRLCSTVFHSVKGHFDYPSDPRGTGCLKTTSSPCKRLVVQFGDGCLDKSADMKSQCVQPVASAAFKFEVGSVTDPFRGKVPQCQGWLSVWAEFTSSVSTRKQRALEQKKLQDHNTFTRLSRRRMLRIMAEVVRQDIRKHFAEATSICLAVDESDGRKVVRARCDTPTAPYRFDCVMGILTQRLDKNEKIAREVTDDCAQATHKKLKEFHRRFFTTGFTRFDWGCRNNSQETQPVASSSARQRKRKEMPKQTLDEKGLTGYRHKVRVLASDGGPSERRALFLSASSEEFPNVNFIIKDMMHCIRIATQKPLHFLGEPEQVFNEIIDKRHALLPDLKNSLKWKSILEAVQIEVLQIPQLQLSGAMKRVLKHLAFAKQRMDSCADPLAKVCLMLLPITVVLALISSDERNAPDQRDRATRLIKKFTPKFIIAMGVSADWGLISSWFLRLFDDGNHDIANSVDEEDKFTRIFESVFVKGGVFHKPSQSSSACGDAPCADEFITERVRRQSKAKCVFRCGNEHTVVWGPIATADLAQLSLETRVAAQTTLDRIHADMGGTRKDFQCLCCKYIAVALGEDAACGTAMRTRLLRALKNLGGTFRLDYRMLQLEYEDAMPVIFKSFQAQAAQGINPSSQSFPNLRVWGQLLDPAFVKRHFPSRVGPFVELVALVRIWICILDGESTVERDFAHVRNFVRAGKICSEESIDEMTVLKLSGPQNPHDLASKSTSGDYVPTEFMLRCAEQWRLLYGARCGISVAQRKPRAKPPVRNKHSFVNVKRSVMRAANRVTEQMAERVKGIGVKTPYGVSTLFFGAPIGERKDKTSVWNKRLQHFSDLTRNKKAENQRCGKFGRSAFPRWKGRYGCSQKPVAIPVMRRLAMMPPYDAAASGAVLETKYVEMGYQIENGTHSCRNASLLIIDSLERFHGPCPSQEWIICAVYMVAKGIPLTTAACANARGGNVRLLPSSNVVHLIPANSRNVDFTFQVEFTRQHMEVVDAVRHCCQDPGSKWKINDNKCKGKVKPPSKSQCSEAARSARQGSCAAVPSRGGKQVSVAALPACGGDEIPTGPKRNERRLHCDVGCLTDLWTVIQQLRRVRNTRGAPVLWIGDRVGM